MSSETVAGSPLLTPVPLSPGPRAEGPQDNADEKCPLKECGAKGMKRNGEVAYGNGEFD